MASATTLAGSGSISIPTKRHDGASQAEPQGQDQDAFSRYSNDVLRMKALLLLNVSEDESADDDLYLGTLAKINETLRGVGLTGLTGNHTRSVKRRKGNSAVPVIDQQRSERKTRLSWELHPSLVMYDMMEELEALENSHYIASDQGEGLEAMSMLFGGQDPAGEDGPPQLRQDQPLNGVATIQDEDEEDDKW
jgi:hypothetical protein